VDQKSLEIGAERTKKKKKAIQTNEAAIVKKVATRLSSPYFRCSPKEGKGRHRLLLVTKANKVRKKGRKAFSVVQHVAECGKGHSR